jgi:hypothetical protein
MNEIRRLGHPAAADLLECWSELDWLALLCLQGMLREPAWIRTPGIRVSRFGAAPGSSRLMYFVDLSRKLKWPICSF